MYILAQPTKFPTIFSQSNGFRLTSFNVDKSKMIKKNIVVAPGEEENNAEEKSVKIPVKEFEVFLQRNLIKILIINLLDLKDIHICEHMFIILCI